MELERRKSNRLRPIKVLQAAFTCTGMALEGRIYKVSSHGVSIEYEARCSLGVGNTVKVISIADTEGIKMLENINFTTIYDIPALSRDQNFSGKKMRQCGMAFAGVDPIQHARLNQLLASPEAN